MKKFLVVMVLVLSLLGCQKAAPKEEAESRKDSLVVGLDDTFMPMGFRDESGEIVGFDIDLAREAAERMEVPVKFQPIDWDVKDAELSSKNIDMIWNGFSITPEREKKILFSKPYLKNRQIIVVLADSLIERKEDLYDKNVTVQADSSALESLRRDETFYQEVTKAGKVVEFPTNIECFEDVKAKRSDAVVVDEVLARSYMKQNSGTKYRVLEDHFGEEEFAVGMRLEDRELKEKLDKALDEMKADGTYDRIQKKWLSFE